VLIEDPGLQVLAVHSPHPKPLLLDALLENPTEQAMHHTHSAQTDHQAVGRVGTQGGAGGNSGVILKDHGGGEPGEFELVTHCMLIRFETFRSCGSEKDFAGPCLIHIFPRHCLVK